MANDSNKRNNTEQVLESAIKQIEKLQQQVEVLSAWKEQKEEQQLSYPLDYTSQSIIQGFVSVTGTSFFQLGGTKGFGLYYGTGSPDGVVPAAQGSLFLNYTGSSTSTRAYINTDGATAWTAVTTAT